MKISNSLTRLIKSAKRWRLNYSRSYSLLADSDEDKDENTTNKEASRNTPVTNYLKSIGSEWMIKHLVPTHIYPRSKGVNYYYLINEKTAEDFASIIVKKLSQKELNCVVVECNPTFGLLTEKLLKHGVPKLHLYETKFNDKGPLVDIIKDNADRLVLHPIQFLRLWMLNYDEEFQKSFAQERQLREWHDDISMVVIATVSDLKFIYSVMMSIVKQNICTEYGRFKMCLAMRPSDWIKLTSTNEKRKLYRWQTILFQVMFNYQLIGKLNRQSFLPWSRYKRYVCNSVYRSIINMDKEEMFVVMIEPMADLFTLYFKDDELQVFSYFVRHCTSSRSRRVIPELEKWAPGCGVKLIALGYNIFTEFGDLTPDEIFNVFRVIITNLNFDKEEFVIQMENIVAAKDDSEIVESAEIVQQQNDDGT